jgi:Glycosyl hydrolase family 62
MADDRPEEDWIGPLLSRHAERRAFDLDAFTLRVMTEVDLSQPRTRLARRRLTPVLIATAAVVAVVVAGSSVSALARWTSRDDRAVVVRSSPSTSLVPGISTAPATPAPSPASSPATSTSTATARTGAGMLPSTFRWSSGAPVISSVSDAGGVTGVKDPSVVFYGGTWHVFVTTVGPAGFGLGYLSFSRWSDAGSARIYPLASGPLGGGYRATPQVFYFAPQKMWYLVYQTGNASYSTNPDISNPNGWSAPKDFYAAVPDLIRHQAGGGWVGMGVICDDTDCYLFSSDNHGHLFRSQTPKASFPNGMSQPVVAAADSGQGTTFAASRVYSVTGTGQYLLLSQAFGGDGHGYLRSWTSPRLTGPWTPLAGTSATPFAGAADITFSPSPWTSDVVAGELIRDGDDQKLTVSPCHLRLLFLGLDHAFHDNRVFRIGLLTQTNSTCP